ncbi:hypothetical protein NLG97_g1175 [Lecanicillium saksenae]|uniref:Uncharacterized protein n=1 Tax=Lecanicillium saksenae TaxID=468837 RepID=A0ACC1R7W2_9HYPO|nr:hypothetical protein NLG97_g1175 [Lecanicillium saksenae]
MDLNPNGDDVFLQDDKELTIAQHALRCSQAFQACMDSPQTTHDPTILEDQMARFALWTSNMDVFKSPNVSLDYRLRYSPMVVEILHQLLDVILNTLTFLKPSERSAETPTTKRRRTSESGRAEVTETFDYSSATDSEGEQGEGRVSLITYTIGGTVSQLFRLSNAVRRSAKIARADKISGYKADEKTNNAIEELRLYTACYIRFRFPHAPQALCSRAHRKRVALSAQHPPTAVKVQRPKVVPHVPVVRFTSSMPPNLRAVNGQPTPPSVPPAPTTHATTAQQTAVRAFYDGTKTETPRAKSVAVNSKLSLPAAPKTTWLSHLENAHGHVWECRAPSHQPIVFQQEAEFQEHSRTEHDVPEAYVGTLSGAARRPGLQRITECPFGDDFAAPENSEPSTVFSSEALQLHIATHLKEISLLALQKLPCDDDADNSECMASDLLSEAEGAARLRDSMYSVLDDEDFDFVQETDEGETKSSEGAIASSVKALGLEDRDEAGMTSLHHAVCEKNLPLIKLLLDRGINLRSRAHDGKTALHIASEQGYMGGLKLLLDRETREITSLKDNFGQTPLHYAAKRGFVEGILLLVDHGAFVDILDEYGLSPYLWAVMAGHIGTIEAFICLGVDANSVSTDGVSALAWATRLGHLSIVQLLLNQPTNLGLWPQISQLMPLEEASARADVPMARLLLQRGADANRRDHDGWLAVHRAAEEGSQDMCQLLLEAGTHIDTTSFYGTGLLHCAANGGNLGTVEMVLAGLKSRSQSAAPGILTCHGWTPLHHAAFMGHADVARLLLAIDMGPDRTDHFYKDNHGWSVLHLAVYGRHLETVNVLLEDPFISNIRLQCDESGLTAEDWLDFEFDGHSYKTIGDLAFRKSRCCRAVTGLRQAAQNGNLALVGFLLQRGDDINGTNSGRRTALYYAAKNGHMAMLDLLLKNGANPNLLPIGRRTWEGFISDDAVLNRLRRYGYEKPLSNEDIDQKIRLALRQHGHSSFFGSLVERENAQEAAQQSSPFTLENIQQIKREEETSRSDETRRTAGLNKLWKTLKRR